MKSVRQVLATCMLRGASILSCTQNRRLHAKAKSVGPNLIFMEVKDVLLSLYIRRDLPVNVPAQCLEVPLASAILYSGTCAKDFGAWKRLLLLLQPLNYGVNKHFGHY